MTKTEIIDLLLEGEIGQAIKAMRAISPNDNIILNLAGQWNRLQKDIAARVIAPDYASLTQNQIMNSLLELAKKLPDTSPAVAASAAGGGGAGAMAGGKAPTVFLSYNHKDMAAATQVKEYLRSKNISVTIDSEAMRSGEDIADFINKCIKESDVTLSLVSTNSLLSAWVGIETMSTLVGEQIAGKKFVSVVIDGAFYDRKFVDTAFTTIEERMAELKELMMARLEKDRGIEDLQSERTRNKNLLNGLPEIVANLRARLNVDISANNFENGMAKVARDILE
ncbi:MAG: toll/interleukin-1 receptor domain-containing protein [Saprospiraceae bacterium]|nr:toll/interleukin-1 receptor domain-containing protein [Saprospiraceae bacterium]MCF8248914.1 toll/interleukin-1 receptor domain-containing protein [Saprospiraceae bacterium]MCF8279125.1 toll/interleukin-1 receptor domain-containing protein [Bacteroidales bacterium]MCF8310808.1 toll/interleukin-1 receptor domain-containing protein [Saprospiraceae bacterium]MCF8439604.1 toll/interleukin-1 receptor domain-containing protein [Saprospiraceae bacterium]